MAVLSRAVRTGGRETRIRFCLGCFFGVFRFFATTLDESGRIDGNLVEKDCRECKTDLGNRIWWCQNGCNDERNHDCIFTLRRERFRANQIRSYKERCDHGQLEHQAK